jgi:hypothetical protein
MYMLKYIQVTFSSYFIFVINGSLLVIFKPFLPLRLFNFDLVLLYTIARAVKKRKKTYLRNSYCLFSCFELTYCRSLFRLCVPTSFHILLLYSGASGYRIIGSNYNPGSEPVIL